jgi:uncharacterized protein
MINGIQLGGFQGRSLELATLRNELDRARPSMLVVFGRRRVGKSRLLLEAVRGRPAVYYQAIKIGPEMSLELFKAGAERALGPDPVLEGAGDWLGVLAYLGRVASERLPGLTVILDEFPYLCEADASIPSVVQKAWDGLRTAGAPLNLVLCGSKLSFMGELLGERNPLHGRQTLELDLGPLPFRDAARFFPGWSPEDRLRAYGVLGGMPYYLGLCDPGRPLAENIRQVVLAPGAPLADEPTHLLQAELREVTRYTTLLRAIADGCTTTGGILGRVRELSGSSALAPYVRKLAELRLIRIERSLDATERERDRRYYLADPFLAFWYRFHLPNASPLAAGHVDEVWETAIAAHLDGHMGMVFEWICRDYVRRYARETLPAPAREVGQVWGKDFDIDVAGRLLDGTPIGGECRWQKAPVGTVVLERLRENVAKSAYYARTSPGDVFLLLFSRSGFTDELRAEAEDDVRVRLMGPAELLLG